MAVADCILTGGRVVLPRAILEGGAIVLRHGKIEAVLEPGERQPQDLPRRDLGRAWVTPGLVEMHIRGCGGTAFEAIGTDPSAGAAALVGASAFLRSRGVTTFVPTVASRQGAIADLASALGEWAPSREHVPGIYVEGPFVNPARRGAIPLEAISDPDAQLLGRLINLARGRIAMMTLAPELPGYRDILARLEAVGVLPCLGHSDCNIDRITLPSGRFSIASLFIDMSPISHETPGLAMLPFLERRAYVELDADGVRVNDSALRICASALETDRLILISNASSAPEGGAEAALVPEVMRHWLKATGSSIPNAVRMLSLTPAQALGIDDRRGAIAQGLDAVLVIWKGEFEVVAEILE
jgi:N-acetylglucosamine-6-phosphate deacetylase